MKNKKINLSKQLILITILSLIVMLISLIIVLPKALEPFCEVTVYSYLEQPLEMFQGSSSPSINKNIVYIHYMDDKVYVSDNYKNVLNIDDYSKVLKYINSNRGKFTYKGKVYYYSVNGRRDFNKKIAITTDSYIKAIRTNLYVIAIPIVIITFSIILVLLLLWSKLVVDKIQRLKLKIDNMTDETFSLAENKYELDDELKLLDDTIDKMKEIILSQEKYKSEMYQNISHDFKTPIMVIKSYIEAYNDGIEDSKTVIDISNEQTNKLENKVKTLLELNKITYLQNSYKNDKKIEIEPILKESIDKYKMINKELDYEIKCDKKNITYDGTEDIWESIINNLLNNFIRYAKEKISITVKENKIIFFNDGENIKEDIIDEIFTPYKKGIKGENGLGLSIVKGNCDLLGYKVNAKNKKNGVEFIISKR